MSLSTRDELRLISTSLRQALLKLSQLEAKLDNLSRRLDHADYIRTQHQKEN